jgi:hypothetical protein
LCPEPIKDSRQAGHEMNKVFLLLGSSIHFVVPSGSAAYLVWSCGWKILGYCKCDLSADIYMTSEVDHLLVFCCALLVCTYVATQLLCTIHNSGMIGLSYCACLSAYGCLYLIVMKLSFSFSKLGSIMSSPLWAPSKSHIILKVLWLNSGGWEWRWEVVDG